VYIFGKDNTFFSNDDVFARKSLYFNEISAFKPDWNVMEKDIHQVETVSVKMVQFTEIYLHSMFRKCRTFALGNKLNVL